MLLYSRQNWKENSSVSLFLCDSETNPVVWKCSSVSGWGRYFCVCVSTCVCVRAQRGQCVCSLQAAGNVSGRGPRAPGHCSPAAGPPSAGGSGLSEPCSRRRASSAALLRKCVSYLENDESHNLLNILTVQTSFLLCQPGIGPISVTSSS
ncbi:unnamed protein product [Rangifer tarandus platyrhynchus]|uniref:Uncharacterized protein n=2 Tax=Rangifer tarandus platyrhynchus TaxID=3082113 RepID=A0AC60A750_RANTA|nr:unnamed protein product [Rangifer tarandus platyrhynchus]